MRKSRWKKRILILSGSCLILLAAGLGFLHTPQAGAWLLGIADRLLTEKTGYSIKAKNTHFSPFSLTIRLEDLTVLPIEPGNDSLQKIHAHGLELQVPWSMLLGKGIHLKKLIIDQPTIELSSPPPAQALPQGSSPPGNQAQEPAAVIPDFRIDRFEVTGGSWQQSGQPTRVGFLLEKMKADIQYDPLKKSHLFSLDIGRGSFSINGSAHEISQVAARGGYQGGFLTVASFKLASQTSNVDLSGGINLNDPETSYRITAASTLALEEWLPLISAETAFEGAFITSVEISGRGQDLTYVGKFSTRGVQHPDLGPIELTGSYQGTPRDLELSGIVLKALGGQIDLASTLSLDDPKPSTVSGNLAGIETQHLAFLLPPGAPAVLATASGQLSATWTKPVLEALQMKAELRVEPAAVLAPIPGRITLSPRGKLSIDADSGRISGRGALTVAGSAASFSGTLDKNRRFKGDLDMTVHDLNELYKTLGLGEQPYLPAVSDEIRVKAQITAKAGHMGLKAQVDASGVAWRRPPPYSLVALTISGHITPEEYVLDTLKLSTEKGKVAGSLAYLPRDHSFQGRFTGSQIPLSIIGPFLPADEKLLGTADFQLEGQGTLEKPGFNLSLRLKNPAYRTWSLPQIDLSAHSDRVKADATLSIPAIGLRAEAGLVLKKPYRVEGKLAMNDEALTATFVCPLEQMENFVFDSRFSAQNKAIPPALLAAWPELKSAKGTLDGHFWLKGNPLDIRTIEAGLDINQLQADLGGLPIVMRDKAALLLQKGELSLDSLSLTSEGSHAQFSGKLALSAQPQINARIRINSDLGRFSQFLPSAVFGGSLSGEIDMKGPLKAPEISGQAEIQGLFFRLRTFPITLTNLKGSLEFKDKNVFLTDFKGDFNGGTLALDGRIDHEDMTRVEASKIRIHARNVSLTYPEGLRTTLDADLELNGPLDQARLTGEASIIRGLFRKNIHPGIELINLTRYVPPSSPEDLPKIFRNLQLDLKINTLDPLRINNNLAKLELETRLTLTGTPAFPLFSGHIRNHQGGQVLLGGRTYTLEKLRLEYAGTPITDFTNDVVAHTQVRYNAETFDITLHITGPMARPEYRLSYIPTNAYPNLTDQDLSFLLLTGKLPSDFSGSALETLGGQVLTHFSTPLMSPITDSLKNLLKAEDVVIEPLVIATETDPGARFTFRKRVSERALFTYSADITRNQRHIWKLDYDLLRSLQIGTYRKEDGSYGASFNHTFQIGRQPKPPASRTAAEEAQILGSVSWEGDVVFPEKKMKALTRRLRPNKPFSFTALHTSIENIRDFYRRGGYANVVISQLITDEPNNHKNILFRILAGKPARFLFRGDSLPKKVKKEVTDTWLGDFPIEVNLAESKILIINGLRLKKYTKATVDTSIEEDNGGLTYVFTVKKGPKTRLGRLIISGAGPLSEKEIKKTIQTYLMAPKRSLWNLIIDEASALEALRRGYISRGYQKAVISPAVFTANPVSGALDVSLTIKPGPCTMIDSIAVTGWKNIPLSDLQKALSLKAKTPFNPIQMQEDQNALISLYRSKGYGDVEIKAQVNLQGETNHVKIGFLIQEGNRHILSGVNVVGNTRTSEKFILREAALPGGSPITPKALSLSTKRLYDSAVFSSVNMTLQASEGKPDGQKTVQIEVEEKPPLSLSYGLRYNSEEKFEAQGALTFANLLGGGRRGLLSYRRNKNLEDIRGSFLVPYLFGQKLSTLVSVYSQKESKSAFLTQTLGATIQQEIRLPLDFSLSYLYRFNRIHTSESEGSGPLPLDLTVNLSEVGLGLLHDSRDDKLNPRSGSYFTASLTYAPLALGADFPYISFFTQLTQTAKLLSKLIWSGSLRLGLADGFDQKLIPSKRFFAGGGTSIRGFHQDALGPINPELHQPDGGEAVLIVNNELRFPIWKSLGGAVFYDVGNVYATLEDLSLSDLRHGAGIGLRYNSPLGIIRLDLGFNLKPRLDESRSVLFFSLGQAF
jgi:outer membrane protein assembly complex protein YaeT